MNRGKKSALGFLPALLALVALLLASCGGTNGPGVSKAAKAPDSQQIYRVGLPVSDVKTLDPAQATDLYSSQSIQMISAGLVEENDQLQVIGVLASSWEASADGLTYTFHLKPGLKFSDGAALTANDVAYSVDRALSPTLYSATYAPGLYLGLLKDAAKRGSGKVATLIGDSLKVVDDNTIQFILTQKAAYFLESLTYPTAWIVEKSLVEKWGTKWTEHLADNGGQASSGPWMIQSYNHSTGITFVPNPAYSGKAPQLKKVQYLFYQQVDSMYKAYLAGQLDNSAVPTADIPVAQKNTAEFKKAPALSVTYAGMNYLYKPFDNIDIRQAFSLAINRDIIAHNIEKDAARPSCHIVPFGMPGYDSNLQCAGGAPTKGDPVKAKALFQQGLQAEGLTVATFPTITIVYPAGAQSTADLVTTMLQDWQTVLGVTIKSQALDFNALVTQINQTTCQTPTTPAKCLNKGLAMWIIAWIADYPDAQDWTTLQFGVGSANDNMNYGQNLSSDIAQQQQVQQQLAQADGDQGPDRISLYNRAEEQLVNDVAWLSLYQRDSIGLIRKDVQGVILNAEALTPPDDWANIYILAH
ncbi:MAG TPA: peptide ABC transporter substrate-binding protein [Ktedonobacteraceae bacterium]|jgi:peptide/nickel transport system substrate-binding protein/oligopeptide transport system substrate-binding protein